jgi:hypothetical protein
MHAPSETSLVPLTQVVASNFFLAEDCTRSRHTSFAAMSDTSLGTLEISVLVKIQFLHLILVPIQFLHPILLECQHQLRSLEDHGMRLVRPRLQSNQIVYSRKSNKKLSSYF